MRKKKKPGDNSGPLLIESTAGSLLGATQFLDVVGNGLQRLRSWGHIRTLRNDPDFYAAILGAIVTLRNLGLVTLLHRSFAKSRLELARLVSTDPIHLDARQFQLLASASAGAEDSSRILDTQA